MNNMLLNWNISEPRVAPFDFGTPAAANPTRIVGGALGQIAYRIRHRHRIFDHLNES